MLIVVANGLPCSISKNKTVIAIAIDWLSLSAEEY
jgi:hypothetical protein